MAGYDKDRDPYKNHIRGRIFENGADAFFRDRENGYNQQSEKFGNSQVGGIIRFDKIKKVDGHTHTIEEKSGRIEGKKDQKQLDVVRALLEQGIIETHILRSVEGETISVETQKLIDRLTREFPGRFTHQIIAREDARRIWALGLLKEPADQLELPGVAKVALQKKTRERREQQQARERDAQQRESQAPAPAPQREPPTPTPEPPAPVVTRDPQEIESRKQLAVAIKAGKDLRVIRGLFEHSVTRQTEAIERARKEGRDIDAQQMRATHATLLERLDMIRKLERGAARDMLTGAGMPPRIVETMGTHMEQGREDQRAKVVAELGAIGQEVQRVDWAHEIARHNERAQALGQSYVQQAERETRDPSTQHQAVARVREKAEGLLMTPEQVAGLDVDMFKAVRYGQEVGYDPATRGKYYQVPGQEPVAVPYASPER